MIDMKKEIYCGFDMTEFNRIRDVLDNVGIKNTYKVVDLVTPSCMMSRLNGIRTASGADTSASKAMKQYYVYVSISDYEKANIIIRKGR